MKCAQCGAELRDTAKICINCGTVVKILTAPEVKLEPPLPLGPTPSAVDQPNATAPSETNTSSGPEPFSPPISSGSRPLFEPAPDLPPLVKNDSASLDLASQSNVKKSYVYAGLIVAAILLLTTLAILLSSKNNSSNATPPASATVPPGRLPSPDASSPALRQNVLNGTADSKTASTDPTAAPNTPSEASLVSKAMLNELLELGRNKSWTAVDEKVKNAKFVTYLRGDRKTARELNKVALDMMGSNDFTGAITKLEQAVSVDRGDIEIRNNLGFAYLRNGKPLTALPHFLEALMMDPTRANAWMNAGEAFAEQDKVPASEAALFLAVHFSRNQAKALEMLNSDGTIIPSVKFQSIIKSVQSNLSDIPQFSR